MSDIDKVKRQIRLRLGANVKEPHGVSGTKLETLRRQFRRREGITLSEFIVRTRLEQIFLKLWSTDLRCCEIAYEIGLREDACERMFKRRTGMTMNEFRRRTKPKTSTATVNRHRQPPPSTARVNRK